MQHVTTTSQHPASKLQHPVPNLKRTFGRTELAQLYFPNLLPKTAWEKLRSWFEINERLSPLLHTGRRTFTPAEVALIIDQLGEP